MATRVSVDLSGLVGSLSISLPQVAKVVELLDAGNTVPFITRYRKDQTGGLDEEQIRSIQSRVNQARLLADRKQTILRSIESQGKLTPELEDQIVRADSSRQLEDLYLPYKPKKRSLATLARERGLETLAREILAADPSWTSLDERAKDFVDPDRKVLSAADALLGAGHILAEQFSERVDFRQRLRGVLERTGFLISTRAESDAKSGEGKNSARNAASGTVEAPPARVRSEESAEVPEEPADEPADEPVSPEAESLEVDEVEVDSAEHAAADELAESATEEFVGAGEADQTPDGEPAPAEASGAADEAASTSLEVAADLAAEPAEAVAEAEAAPGETTPSEGSPEGSARPAPAAACSTGPGKRAAEGGGLSIEQRKQQELEQRFQDFFNYRESLTRIPPHRVLAINRGERARVLRVKVEVDQAACEKAIDELLVTTDHPHADFIRGCARDTLTRLVLPSLERELRRELTDKSESHAVEVFARNLRHLLLQPPVRGKRVLAIDPGFRSGCKLAMLDEFGNVMDHGVMHIVGKQERRAAGRAKLVELVAKHHPQVIVIGNGTACRQTEELVADLITTEWQDQGMAYVIVNEAGASVYSASRLGREELPGYDATLRGTVSIGRRLQDPLSELVKIDPPSIGVGLYQHDVKAKHLRDSLDAVIESCVNFVGVDVNTASPSLLRYVSGLNQLTARRVYDHRVEHGPFRNRNQLKDVPGLGDAGFTQAAGFLKIVDGETPLDASWIHPESYQATAQLLEKVGFQIADLSDKERRTQLADQLAAIDCAALAAELQVGELTLRDIVSQLVRPGRDPREDLPPPIFKRGVLKLEDLSIGMELTGTVLNVVDFGAFVDIGLNDSGLVHISQMADRFVQNPHEVAAVGDIVKVWVLSIDKNRRRVSLTMIDPVERQAAEERRKQQEEQRRQQHERRQARAARPPRPAAPAQASRPIAAASRPAPTAPPQRRRGKPPAEVKLTKEMEQGKAYLNSFGQLKKLLEIREQNDKDDE